MKLFYGLQIMLLGLLVVFLGLVTLIAIIKLISWIMDRKKAEKQPAPVPVPAPVVEEPVEEEETEDPNLPFVIAAAIAACEDNSKCFVVRSVRRVGSGWASNARREQVANY